MREDIIRMAREAGLHLATDVNWMPIIGLEYAEKFAALVAAAERERLAQPEQPEQEPAYRCRPYSSVPNAKVSPPVDYYTTPQPRTWAGSRRSPAWWETRAPQPRTWAGSGDLEDSNAYLAPTQRKPLTDEEIEACRQQGYVHNGLSASFDFVKAARAIEAKLKEKNT